MFFYPNQRQIIINRETVEKASGRLYLVAYQQNLIDAMNVLSHSAFKCYLCLLFNKDKFCSEYSPEAISRSAGICRETARRAFNELEMNGYIVKIDDKHFNFYEVPKLTMKLKPYEEQREFIDDNGEIYYLTYKQLQEAIGKENVLSLW